MLKRSSRVRLVVALCLAPAVLGCAGRQSSDGSPEALAAHRAALATPAALRVGDPAPQPAFREWIKGDPVVAFEPGRVYVLDFWATWCGPCIASMPHVSGLAERIASVHGDRVRFIAVAIVDDDSTPARIRRTARRYDGLMRFGVAIDAGATSDGYRLGTRDLALPRAFVIDGAGRLAWFGHPVDLDDVVESVAAGTWDMAAAAERFRIREQAAIETRLLVEEYLAGDAATQLAVTEAVCGHPIELVEGMSPPYWAWPARARLLVSAGRGEEAIAVARQAEGLQAIAEDPMALAELGVIIAPVSIDDARRLAESSLLRMAAIETAESTDPWEQYLREAAIRQHTAALAWCAEVHEAAGDCAKAVAIIRMALPRAPDDPRHWPNRAWFAERLARCEGAAID
ncbi:MAG TPA: TlpA disulfide reductase family protein [Phycisphaerales bacterium]|nr:TlpA disulfide reductase family protein [Phycisphaerales bacterium]HMP38681.1 TlpA disulfide reductase family protein [Phycisphaerales bacterium]